MPGVAKRLSQFQRHPGLAGGYKQCTWGALGASRGDFMHALDANPGHPSRHLANIVGPDGIIQPIPIGLGAVRRQDQSDRDNARACVAGPNGEP